MLEISKYVGDDENFVTELNLIKNLSNENKNTPFDLNKDANHKVRTTSTIK